ncbi:MAG: cytochrome c [Xanthobacteraceae bacterium]|nr:cytochrome c [Xanthobacteraceae bacterium]
MKRIFVTMAAVLLGAGAVFAQQDIVNQRQTEMKNNAKNLGGVLVAMVKGEKPYDQAAVDAALGVLVANAKVLSTQFPDSTKGLRSGDKYSASPKIWENRADFESHLASFAKVVNEAKASVKDLDTLKATVPLIGKQCANCHETYRLKDG